MDISLHSTAKPINPYPYTHQIADCGALCRIVRKGKGTRVTVQTANGFYVHTNASDLTALIEINGLPLRRADAA
jgi:hypothetical protein